MFWAALQWLILHDCFENQCIRHGDAPGVRLQLGAKSNVKRLSGNRRGLRRICWTKAAKS